MYLAQKKNGATIMQTFAKEASNCVLHSLFSFPSVRVSDMHFVALATIVVTNGVAWARSFPRKWHPTREWHASKAWGEGEESSTVWNLYGRTALVVNACLQWMCRGVVRAKETRFDFKGQVSQALLPL